MSLNELKKTLNMLIKILYELKMGLNELKWVSLKMSWKEPRWPQMSLNELKTSLVLRQMNGLIELHNSWRQQF